MNFPLLKRYLLKAAAETTDPALQNNMVQLLSSLSSGGGAQQQDASMKDNQDDSVIAPELSQGLPNQKSKIQGVEDLMMHKALPELLHRNPEKPEMFGKLTTPTQTKVSVWTQLKRASKTKIKLAAYIKDVKVADLPIKLQDELQTFISKDVKNPTVIHYGMMVKELLDRADLHNLKAASEHVTAQYGKLDKTDKEKAKQRFFDQAKDKYIFLVNDTIVDGHHFLAKAKFFNVTNSLNVLDLTPARFQ